MQHDENNSDRQEKFLRLFLASERELFRYVSALVPAMDDASEIVQQTALQLWNKFDDYDPGQPFTPWACRFGLNVAKQWMASRQRWAKLLETGVSKKIFERREMTLSEMENKLRHLDNCIEKLPETDRALVERFYWRRENVRTICETLNQTAGAVYKTLQRIRQQLRDCIELASKTEGNEA